LLLLLWTALGAAGINAVVHRTFTPTLVISTAAMILGGAVFTWLLRRPPPSSAE
jgi:hypothetical protein